MSAKQLNPAYDGMTDQQVKRFKYWEFRTMAMCIFGYALFYFVRKNLSIAMPISTRRWASRNPTSACSSRSTD